MREIKFRAWDKGLKVMNKQYMWGGRYLIEHGQDLGCVLGNTDRFEIMQYTGLKDKNGKEIYEGDIVRTALYGLRDCEVVFMKAGFYLLLDTGIGTNLYPMSDVGMEIIGNIYETPELL